MLFVNIVLPVLLTALVGYVYARAAKPDPRPISGLALYALIPALVFTSLMETQVTGREIGQITSYSLLLTGSITLLAWAVIRLWGLNRERANALLLTSVFMNTANYGLPVVLYAVGEAGFARAVIFVITQTFLVYSLGVYFAAAGKLDARRALMAIVKLPTFHAALAALVFRGLDISLPNAVLETVSSLGQAGIVLMLVLLGMQLAQVQAKLAFAHITVASAIRLAISPLIGFALVRLLNMDTVTGQAMILEAAMPTAVITSLLAMEFGSAPGLVSSTVFATTILSFASITVVLGLLF